MDERRGPLAGVRVVDLSSFLSGPFAGTQLADLGADVVKVEPPKGDAFRRFGRPPGPVSAPFVNVNRGKRSVVLDLKERGDVERLCELLAGADVMITNWRPGVAARLGLDDAALDARNPRLIRMYVSGWGQTGPLADLPAFDSAVQVRSGLAWAEGDGEPEILRGWVVDKLTATFVAQTALAALFERERTGRGRPIEVAMLDTMAYFDFPDYFANRTLLDHQPAEQRYAQAASNRVIHAADGTLICAPVTAAQIRAAVTAVGHPEWGDELLAMRDGAALTSSLLDRLETVTRTLTLDECLRRFGQHDVPASPCLDLDHHLADEQVAHNEIYEIVEQPGLGRVRVPRHPARCDAWGRRASPVPSPLLDEGRADVLGGP